MHDPSTAVNPSTASYSAPYVFKNAESPVVPRRSMCCFGRNAKPLSNRHDEALLCCCCRCSTSNSSATALTCLGVCILVLAYTLIGAFVFMALEETFYHQREETAVAASKPNLSASENIVGVDIRSKTVEKLWSITEDLNILYKDNWTRLAAQEIMEFQDTLVRAIRGSRSGRSRYKTAAAYGQNQQYKWTLSTSFLYSLTMITTIGYGNVTPRSAAGKLVAMFYAFMGIPLVLVYLSTLGDVLARSFRKLYGRSCRACTSSANANSKKAKDKPTSTLSGSLSYKGSTSKFYNEMKSGDLGSDLIGRGSVVFLECMDPGPALLGSSNTLQNITKSRHCLKGCPDQIRVPISLCMLIVLVYIALGAVLFNRTEDWSFLEGTFFCFSSLGTIGFGDLTPGHYASTISSNAEDIAICICCVYIIVGMAVVAMCFNLIQDEVVVLVRRFNNVCGGGVKDNLGTGQIDDEVTEDISMSLMS